MAGSLNLKSFTCANCNAPQTIRGLGQTTTLACTSCGSLIDITNESYAILQRGQRQANQPLLIPLGHRGKFNGITYEVIGLLVRVDGSGLYQWQEYLLFNPYQGFAWLVQNQGHWSYVVMIKGSSELLGFGSVPLQAMNAPPTIRYDRTTFRRYLCGPARVRYVYGEFYWRVKVNDSVNTIDYIHPPLMLSAEQDGAEQIWSLGHYVERSEIAETFALPISGLPEPIGIGAHQPAPGQSYASSVYAIAWLFVGIAILLHLAVVISQKNEIVLDQGLTLAGGGTGPVVLTRPFEIRDKVANLSVTLGAPILNNWIDYDIDLVDATTGATVELNSELSYYTGSDSDGVWVEGSQEGETFVPSVSPGTYYLALTPTAGADQVAIPYSIKVVHDKTYHGNFWGAAVLMLALPLTLFIRRFIFERVRWQDSD